MGTTSRKTLRPSDASLFFLSSLRKLPRQGARELLSRVTSGQTIHHAAMMTGNFQARLF
jgi:hypothetical protein